MEEFGFNKIDEDDIYDKKSDMNSLYEIQSMQEQSNDVLVDDINIESTIPDITAPDDFSEETTDVSIGVTNLSDVMMVDDQNNPLPNELDIQEGRVNPLPNELDIQDSPVNQAPITQNPLENMYTEDSLAVKTSRNLQANTRLSFDLQNSNYVPSTPSKPSPVEKTLSQSPARDNIDFEVAASTATDSSSKRTNRKKARPEWRTRHG